MSFGITQGGGGWETLESLAVAVGRTGTWGYFTFLHNEKCFIRMFYHTNLPGGWLF